MSATWRESASLILLARTVFSTNNKYDYKLLCLKRSSKSDFMPSNYVFPGGNLCKSDCDMKWMKLYADNGFHSDSFEELTPRNNIPTIMSNNEPNTLPKELAFRICAIRETFEECGVLLCKTRKIHSNSSSTSCIGGTNLEEWQRLVNDNSEEFLNLCTKYQIYPDVWALNNWINWITPTALPKKFNTLFFLAALNQVPSIGIDRREVEHFMWSTPENYLQLNGSEAIMLPVPQFYEISRLALFSEIDHLSEFAKNRSEYGFEHYWPYRIKTKDALYSILPGDDLYPIEIDITKADVDYMEELPATHIKHRIQHKSFYENHIIIQNFSSKSRHVVPRPLK